jgi:error-prone DNA polymerase
VTGLAQATGERIVAARGARPFRSLADLVDRARPSIDELEALILAGALEWTGRSRPSLLLEARAGARSWAKAREVAGIAGGAPLIESEPVAPVAVPQLPEFDLAQRVRGETRATGLWFSGHPLDVLVDASSLDGATAAAEIERHVGRRVVVAGMPCAYRRVETKQGGLMLFMTLADRTGLVECVLFPDAYRAYASAARGQVVRAEGRVDETLGALTLGVERAQALDGGPDHFPG